MTVQIQCANITYGLHHQILHDQMSKMVTGNRFTPAPCASFIRPPFTIYTLKAWVTIPSDNGLYMVIHSLTHAHGYSLTHSLTVFQRTLHAIRFRLRAFQSHPRGKKTTHPHNLSLQCHPLSSHRLSVSWPYHAMWFQLMALFTPLEKPFINITTPILAYKTLIRELSVNKMFLKCVDKCTIFSKCIYYTNARTKELLWKSVNKDFLTWLLMGWHHIVCKARFENPCQRACNLISKLLVIQPPCQPLPPKRWMGDV